MDITSTLKTLLGRDPTVEEVNKLHTIKSEFGMSDNDPAWAIIAAFGHYEFLYASIPEKISKASLAALEEHRVRLEATADATKRQVERSMAEQVTTTVEKLSADAIRVVDSQLQKKLKNNMAISITIATLIASVCLSISFYAGYSINKDSSTKITRRFGELNNTADMLNCSDKRFTKTNSGTCQGEWRVK